MSARFRTPSGGHIDRDREVRFTFDGTVYTGHPGDTVASALLAHGVHAVASSVKLGRPRGVSAAWAEDSGGLIQVEHPFPEPMLLAATTEITDGLVTVGLPGQGRLATEPDPARYDARHLHCDVLVVGAGPAGLAAAVVAARRGDRVVLVDERPQPGGSLAAEPAGAAQEWVRETVAELDGYRDVTHLQRTTAFGHYDDGFMLALERRTDHLGVTDPTVARQRVWRIRAAETVIATGAHERPIVFAGNDRPGVMLAASARDFLHRYGVLVGERVVVFTTGDAAYRAAFDLQDAGVAITAIVDARPQAPARLAAACAERGIDLRAGTVVVAAHGETRVTGVDVAADGAADDTVERLDCDTVLVSGGWNPAVHLFSQVRGRLRFDDALGAFVPAEPVEHVSVVGAATGSFDTAGCLRAGAAAVRGEVTVPAALDGAAPDAPSRVLWRVAAADPTVSFVDVQRDVTVTEVTRAIGAGMNSMEHIKRYTTLGTAHDQGKTSGVIASGITAEVLGVAVGDLGTTTFRPPYTPVAFAALAGRSRGDLFDPVRTTAVHDWHVARGAVFEDVGQWKRPRYYPLTGPDDAVEDMDTAVLRECAAVRRGVGILDGSTLGKIDVRGADSGWFMDMMYTNLMSTLKPGFIRYGVMCGVDGMVIDDGTVMRIADDHYIAFTTTGGAATILEWMEQWLQTEWPHLDVFLTSVTDHWQTYPVVGPKSRELLGRVVQDVDLSNEAFGFMQGRDGHIAGVAVRLGRVSFSGELAFEVNVEGRYAPIVWDAIIAAGADLGLTPYGTETMHVLRAEKGYPIIGQDTDGTVTPQDLGMSWAVSKKKPDFLGKRSFAREENANPQRKQFVGLLPSDGVTVLPEGAQIIEFVEGGVLPPPPVPMLGHVTSSYRSAELDRPFALALVRAGHSRTGDVVHAVVDGTPVPVEVTGTVFVDPEGARRDG
ncbi:FAD-dependent oxidoreductase [Tsukamurella asaccharolytica]|uniref:Sarcosine oxidase subunit alpha n=1 Tax=Tsukamurella asaccharolytica TaxID=2592067 RepID=A0A5C5R6Y2_9ACTN|nr:FAD-dependent oxidoreductase [Tsukamurella asaccharolytica]TWS17935.1 FAD-dependent oxidoreductase [Tsukamurella asaccharolytica]